MDANAQPGPVRPAVAYTLHTPRLVLRCLGPHDVRARKEAVDESGDHLRAFSLSGTNGSPFTLEQHVAAVRRARSLFDGDGDRIYAAFERHPTGEEGRLIGEGALLRRAGLGALELGYWVSKNRIRNGYGTELAEALVWCAFQLDGVSRVDILCEPGNVPSIAIAKRLGFTWEGTLRARQPLPHHARADLSAYSLLDSEFPRSPAAQANIEALDFLGRPLAPRSFTETAQS